MGSVPTRPHEAAAQARIFKALHEVALAASGVLDPAELASLTIDHARSLLEGDTATLYWWEESEGRLVRIASNNARVNDLHSGLPSGVGVAGEAFSTGRPVVVDDYRSYANARREMVELGIRSAMALPLLAQDRSVGVLLVATDRRRAWQESDLELLRLFAAQITPAIVAARLAHERDQQAHRFHVLHELAVAAGGVLDLGALARLTVDRTRDIVNGWSSTLVWFESGGVRVLSDNHPVHFPSSGLAPGQGMSGQVRETGEMVVVDDYPAWEHAFEWAVKGGVKSMIGVPVKVQDETVGCLLVRAREIAYFKAQHRELLQLLAAQVGPAIQAAWLSAEREKQARLFRGLHDLAVSAAGVLETKELAKLAVERCRALLQVDGTVLFHYDPEEGLLVPLHETAKGVVDQSLKPGEGAIGLAFSTRRPYAVEDYKHWEHHLEGPSDRGLVSGLSYPLVAGDQAIGVLGVWTNEKRTWNESDVQILSLVAAQVGPALHTAAVAEAHDIQAEQLATSERRLRLIFDTSPLVIARTDLKGVPLEVNPAVEAMFGYTPEEAVGKRPGEFIDRAQQVDDGRFEMLAKGDVDHHQMDQPYRRKDGSTFWGHTTISLVRDSEGRPDYWYTIIEDVTERRRAAEAVQVQADTFKALNEVAVAAAGVLEPTELARIAAERARELLGASGGSLTWFDDQRQGLRILADTEIDFDAELVLPVSRAGAQGQAWLTGAPVAIEDYHGWDKRVATEVGRVKSALVVPLQVRQRRIGTLAVNYHEPRTFRPQDVQLLSLLAAEVAPSLEAARLHEDLVASTRSIRAIFDTAPVGIARLDVQMNILGLNRRAEELTGHDSSELVGRSITLSLIGAGDLDVPVRDLLAGRGDQLRFERQIRRKGGGSFLADLTLTAVRNPSGEAEFLYAMFDDITERKRAEEALRASEARKGAIVESALDCIIAADHEGRIIEFNPAAERTFGYRRRDVLGKGIWETIVPPHLRARHLEALEAAPGADRKVVGRRIETTGLRADGAQFPIELSVAAYQQEGKTMFSVSIRDLTERVHMETMRQESEAKSRFVAAMSHELRTPLNSILGFSQLLSGTGTGELNERQQRYVGHIESSGRHLLALINDVLDLSKVAAGQMEVELEPIELQPLLEEAISQLRPQADAKPLDLLLDPSPQVWIRADRRRFMQVMLNLLANAIKFTPAGGLVRVRASRAGRSADIAVIDTGIGIPLEEQERIFEEFTQVERTSAESAEGTGLGLALSKRLLQLMRGSIGVESTVGNGSVFTVTIPRVRPGEVADSRPLLLVVHGADEDASLLTQLETGPYRVIATTTVREAALVARRRRLAGIIVGDSLSESDESWLREALRDHPKTQSLPILSAAVALHPGVLIRD